MMTAPAQPNGALATPLIKAETTAQWEALKPSLRVKFEDQIYGTMPKNFGTQLVNTRPITSHNFNATIEEITLNTSNGETYKAILVMPKQRSTSTPIIMMENFCPNHAVIPASEISKPQGEYFDCSGDGMMSNVFGYFFGRYITTPPINMIMKRGYALAIIYPPSTYPDNAQLFFQARKTKPELSFGAIGAWAYQFSTLSHYLKTDPRFSETIAYGHSRYGKAVLLAAAFDETIDGAIAHQSGTGGASLSRNKKGETVADITKGYPHWFSPSFQEDTLTIDQHHLLALIAPRPILLGNAKRDVWSDPEGAFRAAKGASPVYKLYNSDGLQQTTLTQFDPSADIAFWMRPGTHGVVKEDWPAFLEFMDAHFK